MYNINDKASAIRNVQRFIREITRNSYGSSCVYPDGIYGTQTRNCVAAFQRENGIGVTGTVNYKTFLKLVAAYNDSILNNALPDKISILPRQLNNREIAPGEESNTVAIIQGILKTLAVMYKNIDLSDINGIYDDNTENAVMEVQRSFGIPVTGRIDKQTWNAIANAYEKFKDSDT